MKLYQPKHMLVTGGAGFIGSNFIRYSLATEPNIHIINLDKLTYAGTLDNLKNLPDESRHHFIQGDINDATLIRHVLNHHRIDTIVHFAAESHVDRSIEAPANFIETNVMGTFNLLEAARHQWLNIDELSENQCRFHHISTDEVYGSLQPGDPAFTENTAYQPRSPYSASKAGSDHLVQAYHHTYGLPVTITNCSNNFGPYQHPEKLIPTIIRACMNEKSIPIYGAGDNIRDWLFVTDHCDAILKVIKQGQIGETYNIGGNNEWNNLQLATFICEQMDKHLKKSPSCKQLIQFVTDRPGHDFRYAIDMHKIANELQWRPQVSFEHGIQKTIDFYMK